MPRQWVATVAVHQLPELSELSQWEIIADQMGHPVHHIALLLHTYQNIIDKIYLERATLNTYVRYSQLIQSA